jgi:hypothetical protein
MALVGHINSETIRYRVHWREMRTLLFSNVCSRANDWRCAAALRIDAAAGGRASQRQPAMPAARGRFLGSAVGTNVC